MLIHCGGQHLDHSECSLRGAHSVFPSETPREQWRRLGATSGYIHSGHPRNGELIDGFMKPNGRTIRPQPQRVLSGGAKAGRIFDSKYYKVYS